MAEPATAETFHLQQLAQEPPCPRCNGQLYGRSAGECLECQAFDETARELGWDEEAIYRELMQMRSDNAQRLAQERAETAGKSDQQINAEREQRAHHEQQLRASIEPVIATPACVTDPTRSRESYTEQEQAEVDRWYIERRFALPVGVPELAAPSPVIPCSFVYQGETEKGYVLAWSTRALLLGTQTGGEPHWIGNYPFNAISSISIQGSDAPDRQVTKPRALAFGLFSLAAKKERKRSFLLVENHASTPLLLEFDGLLPVELQAQLSPLLSWYEQHRAQLTALHQLWNPGQA